MAHDIDGARVRRKTEMAHRDRACVHDGGSRCKPPSRAFYRDAEVVRLPAEEERVHEGVTEVPTDCGVEHSGGTPRVIERRRTDQRLEKVTAWLCVGEQGGEGRHQGIGCACEHSVRESLLFHEIIGRERKQSDAVLCSRNDIFDSDTSVRDSDEDDVTYG